MVEYLKTRLCQTSRKWIEERCEQLLLTSYVSLTGQRWHDAIYTLGKLHRLTPGALTLSDFGKPSGFYSRQIRTLSTISESQARVADVVTNTEVGRIPYFENMVAFFRQPETQPRDRTCLIHGDYKIDNLVFHKTDPRVIGILECVSPSRGLTRVTD